MIKLNNSWQLFTSDERRKEYPRLDGSVLKENYLPLYHTPCARRGGSGAGTHTGIVVPLTLEKATCGRCKEKPPKKIRDKVRFLLGLNFD